jgi:hypothetical protein
VVYIVDNAWFELSKLVHHRVITRLTAGSMGPHT